MWPSVYSFTITNTLSLSEVSLYATKSCYSAGGTYTPRLASEFIMLDVISSVIIRPSDANCHANCSPGLRLGRHGCVARGAVPGVHAESSL